MLTHCILLQVCYVCQPSSLQYHTFAATLLQARTNHPAPDFDELTYYWAQRFGACADNVSLWLLMSYVTFPHHCHDHT